MTYEPALLVADGGKMLGKAIPAQVEAGANNLARGCTIPAKGKYSPQPIRCTCQRRSKCIWVNKLLNAG